MGWVKDKGGSSKFQFGGQVPAVPRVGPQVPMYEEGGKVADSKKRRKKRGTVAPKNQGELDKARNQHLQVLKDYEAGKIPKTVWKKRSKTLHNKVMLLTNQKEKVKLEEGGEVDEYKKGGKVRKEKIKQRKKEEIKTARKERRAKVKSSRKPSYHGRPGSTKMVKVGWDKDMKDVWKEVRDPDAYKIREKARAEFKEKKKKIKAMARWRRKHLG